MLITAFNGSPRAERSNTHFMVSNFLLGAQKEGAKTDNVFLVKKDIKPCTACFTCWLTNPSRCAINDDMKDLIEKFINSDIVVIATPLYVDNVSGIMKNFIDRLLPLVDPHFEKDENGESRHVKKYDKFPLLVAISNCGFPEDTHFQVLKLLFKRMARNLNTKIIAEIYRSAGELLGSKSIFLKPIINRYKNLLIQAGQDIVKIGKISEDVQKKLNEPIISPDLYIKKANHYWDKKLKKLK